MIRKIYIDDIEVCSVNLPLLGETNEWDGKMAKRGMNRRLKRGVAELEKLKGSCSERTMVNNSGECRNYNECKDYFECRKEELYEFNLSKTEVEKMLLDKGAIGVDLLERIDKRSRSCPGFGGDKSVRNKRLDQFNVYFGKKKFEYSLNVVFRNKFLEKLQQLK